MHERTHTLRYHAYAAPTELPPADGALLAAALGNLDTAHAPYSHFRVSAAARLANGSVVLGTNFENAAYPMCLCAERTVLASCFSQFPHERIDALAITVRSANVEVDRPASPCGACRQVIAEVEERQGAPIRTVLYGMSGPVWIFERGGALLPFGFSGRLL